MLSNSKDTNNSENANSLTENSDTGTLAMVLGTDETGSNVDDKSMLANREASIKNTNENIEEMSDKAVLLVNGQASLDELLNEGGEQFDNNSDSDKFMEATDGGIRFRIKDLKPERIKKLKESEPIRISGNEILWDDDLKTYRKNAYKYGMSIRGNYKNEDNDQEIAVTKNGIKEVLSHDTSIEQIQSIAAIPGIIEKSIYIDSRKNEDVEKHPEVESYDYYVCGLKIGETDYTVKAVVAKLKSGERYYDHRLTQIEKGELISTTHALPKHGEEINPPLSDFKDKRLISILQENDRDLTNDKISEQFEAEDTGDIRFRNNFMTGPELTGYEGDVKGALLGLLEALREHIYLMYCIIPKSATLHLQKETPM